MFVIKEAGLQRPGETPGEERSKMPIAANPDLDTALVTTSTCFANRAFFRPGEVAPRATEIDPRTIPDRPVAGHGRLGLLGVTVREEFGGAGIGYLAHCVAMEEISRSSASVGLSYGAHSNFLRQPDFRRVAMLSETLSTQAHLRRACRRIGHERARRRSDVVSMRLRAEKRGDRYVLNGTKMWITNGPDAETLVVYAKTEPDAGPRGITAFLIEKGMPGFRRPRSSTSSACAAPTLVSWCSGQCRTCGKCARERQPGRECADERPGLRARGARRRPTRHHASMPGCGAAVCPRTQTVRHSRSESSS